MKKNRISVGKNHIYQIQETDEMQLSTAENVSASWKNSLNLNCSNEKLRVAQRGALFSIKAHWTVSDEPATIVMPTGTGKTETMIATVVSEMIHRTLIIVPSNLLRKQTAEKFLKFGILQEIGVIDKLAIKPVVSVLKTTPASLHEMQEILERSNVVITTMSLLQHFDDSYLELFCQKIDALIVDEAHHIAANNWSTIKYKLKQLKCLQFTATPFRNDGKKVDGKIIYNFPLSKAQEEGFFQKINFRPILEFDETKGDMSIAIAAVSQLDKDLKNGHNHVVLVRAKDKTSANRLYYNVYNKYFQKYNPVLIHSGITAKEKNESLASLKNGKSKIVVCVDMFGEGIDIPNLKIAAIHDKYKSLPITLQFIGRFARTSEGLGNATIITNIADDKLNESLQELYSQDSDWNTMLNVLSDREISKEISLQELAQGFDISSVGGITIQQLRPKVSMIAYHTETESWNVQKLYKLFDPENSFFTVNEERKIIAIIERVDSNIEWSTFKGINDTNWHLHLIYWNPEIKTCFINSTDKGIADDITDLLFEKNKKIDGEIIFRCLHNIKRLMLGTVGLRSAIDGPIRYKMFAGIDVGNGIAESQIATTVKSNLFGTGYDGRGKVSIGCSYKGRIWSRWVEDIEYWTKWCDKIATSLNDETIDTRKVFEGALVPEIVSEIPRSVPYGIEWPMDLELLNDNSIVILCDGQEYPLYDVNLALKENVVSNSIRFAVYNDNFNTEFEFEISADNYKFVKKNGKNITIKYRRREYSAESFFHDFSPRIKFVDQSILEGNYLVKISATTPCFKKENILVWNWNNVNIKVESQGPERNKDSIQYKVIEEMKKQHKYSVIFDDDASGEVADIICIDEQKEKIVIHFIHCKYSKGEKPGSRVEDLYEVCGQAEKSIKWCQEPSLIIDHLIKREIQRISKSGITRFEEGNIEKLREIKNKMRFFSTKFEMSIVQPGMDSNNISDDMKRLLNGTMSYLMDTYSIDLQVICS